MKQSQLSKFQCPDSGIRLELKKIKTLLNIIGNPQNKISFVVHIAGTNGKGSTLAFLESLLRGNTNLKIGKYTSPHLICITERFNINGENISKERFENIFEELNKIEIFKELTYFEQLTAIAFKFFEEEKVDLLLLETGLGGRLDATNIIKKPSLCLITNISYDHTEYLGNTIKEIAFEKAGILKTKIPFCTTATGESLEIIRKRAIKINSIEIPLDINLNINESKLGLYGSHQKENALLALNAFIYLIKNDLRDSIEYNLINYEEIYKEQNWKGRFQRIKYNNKPFILDGAHNPAGAKVLKYNLSDFLQKKIFLLGFLKTKNYKDFLIELLDYNKKQIIILTNPSSEDKSSSLEEIKNFLQENYPNTQIILQTNTQKAFEELNEQVQNNKNSMGVISGSLYLVGEILNLLQNK